MKEIIGIDKYGKRVFVSDKAKNLFKGAWGGTGSGKTVWIDSILSQKVQASHPTNILRFAWHSCTQKNQRLPCMTEILDKNTFTVYPEKELPLKIFDSRRRDSLSDRERAIEIDRITDIISSAAKLPMTQKAATLAAVRNVYDSEDGIYERMGLRAVGENLLDLGVTARNAYTKLHPVFEGTNIVYGNLKFDRPICELDLNSYDNTSQRVIMNLVISYYYDKAKRDDYLKDGFIVVIDEAQNADLREGQIISEMMMESRKKNVQMILATPQPLTDSRRFEAMMQCGSKLFFKPAGYEDKLARIIDPRHELDMTLMLKQLKLGEFVATGQFVTEDGVEINRPIKLRTYIPGSDEKVQTEKVQAKKAIACIDEKYKNTRDVHGREV